MTVNGPGAAGEPKKHIQAYEGISLDTIKKNGTEADVRAINIYDANNDGKLTGEEVSMFNNTQRTLSEDAKTLTITNKQDGRNQEIKVTSSAEFIDENKGGAGDRLDLSEDHIVFGQHRFDSEGYVRLRGRVDLGDNAKVDINIDAGTLSIKGAEGTNNSVGVVNGELNIKDSEINHVNSVDSKVTLDGVHDKTMFFETDTEVKLNGNSILNQKDSQIDVNE